MTDVAVEVQVNRQLEFPATELANAEKLVESSRDYAWDVLKASEAMARAMDAAAEHASASEHEVLAAEAVELATRKWVECYNIAIEADKKSEKAWKEARTLSAKLGRV